jgi:hypothetical protein
MITGKYSVPKNKKEQIAPFFAEDNKEIAVLTIHGSI